MSRRPSSTRSKSNGSERSAGGSRRDQEVSLNLYSAQNGHWGTMMYPAGEKRGRMYHARSDPEMDDDRFYYDERDQPIESQSSYGRSVLGRLSSGERERAAGVIRAYASHDENIPRYSRHTNCQNFATGVIGALESSGFIHPGHEEFFAEQRGRPGREIARSLENAGRSWIPAEPIPDGYQADARYYDQEERRPTGRLNIAAMEGLLAPQQLAARRAGPSQSSQPSLPSGSNSGLSRSRSGAPSSDPLDGPHYFRRRR